MNLKGVFPAADKNGDTVDNRKQPVIVWRENSIIKEIEDVYKRQVLYKCNIWFSYNIK